MSIAGYLDRPKRSLAEVERERKDAMALSSTVERTPEEMNEALRNRMEMLADCLVVIDGMTKRGAVLPPDYMENLEAMRRYAQRIFGALTHRGPVNNPWDRSAA